MTVYTIRPEFTIHKEGIIYLGGEDVDLNAVEFELHKHKLEGVESSVVPEGQGNGTINNSDGECCFPAPYISNIDPVKLSINQAGSIEIRGSFFTPDTTVNISGSTVNNVEFVDSHLLLVTLTAGNNAGFYDISIDNGEESIVSQGLELFESSAIIVDLRSGGTAFSNAALSMRSGMSFTRTTTGLNFAGSSPWSSWARFVGDNNDWVWDRTTKKRITWIYTNSSSFMVGLGSFENNPNSNSQWREGEMMGYYTSGTNFYGFYSNNGTPGNYVNQVSSKNVNSEIKKLVLENNGEPGSTFYLYELQSIEVADWTNTDTLVHSGIIANNMTADALQIMPFCIPQGGAITSFIGFIIEDM